MVGNVTKQVIVETRGGFGDSAVSRRREPATGNDHAVVSLIDGRCAGDKAGRGINCYRLGRIVKPRIEQDHVPPFRMIGNNDRVADTIANGQLLSDLPGILSEALVHVGAEDGVGAVADFRIGVEEAQSGVRNSDSGATSAVVREQKLAILVVRASGAGLNVDLIVVVLAGSLKQESEFEQVISLDPSETVGRGVNGHGRVRGIGSTA